MKILYGVVGEGMGHATRSSVVIDYLLAANHHVHVVVSGRAHDFLKRTFTDRDNIVIDEIHGLFLEYDGNTVDKSESLWANLEEAPQGIKKNIEVYSNVVEKDFSPEMVISDFESWAYLYGINHQIPVVSLDNMQIINRCRHNEVLSQKDADYYIAKWAVKLKLPGAYHYLATSFFFPEVKKERTTLVPPILRRPILDAERAPGEHVLVYQTAAANEELIELLQRLPYSFKLYGLRRSEVLKNVTLCEFSEAGFIDDLRTAKAVIAGGGFSLMGEAVHLGVPMYAVPLESQFEQELNARWLQHMGYGVFAESFTKTGMFDFLANLDAYSQALKSYPGQDNAMLFECLDELIRDVSLDEPPKLRLEAKSLGAYWG
jgi:uncharacterized protein (TIGR00661 family)